MTSVTAPGTTWMINVQCIVTSQDLYSGVDLS